MSFEGDTASFPLTVEEEPPDVPLSSLHALPVLSPAVEEGNCQVLPAGRTRLGSPRLFSPPPRTPRGNPQTRAFRKAFFAGASDQEWNDWRWQLRHRIRTLGQLESMLVLSGQERQALVEGGSMLPVGITPYYASLSFADRSRSSHCGARCFRHRGIRPHAGRGRRSAGRGHAQPGRPAWSIAIRTACSCWSHDFCSTYCRYCTRSRVVGHGEIIAQRDSGWKRPWSTSARRRPSATCLYPAEIRWP